MGKLFQRSSKFLLREFNEYKKSSRRFFAAEIWVTSLTTHPVLVLIEWALIRGLIMTKRVKIRSLAFKLICLCNPHDQ